MRNALTTFEGKGIVEATEEHHPVHLHVAVLVPPGSSVVLPQLPTLALATRPVQAAPVVITHSGGEVNLRSMETEPASRGYLVRQGDTLWDIANRLGTSPAELAKANGMSPQRALRPGTTLKVPGKH